MSRQRAARGVDRWRRDDDDDVRLVQHARHRRMHQPGAAVGQDDVVEPLQDPQHAAIVGLGERF